MDGDDSWGLAFPLMAAGDEPDLGIWTPAEHKAFEAALALHVHNPDRWELVASCLPNREAWQVEYYYHQLERDVQRIEEGLTSVPLEWGVPTSGCAASCCDDELELSDQPPISQQPRKKAKLHTGSGSPSEASQSALQAKKRATGEQNRPGELRKGVPWTEEEHRLFLAGLAKFGKGDWRSIARNYVISRTPTQVASHAQKYFIRQSGSKKSRARASIHDITHAQQQAAAQQAAAQQAALQVAHPRMMSHAQFDHGHMVEAY